MQGSPKRRRAVLFASLLLVLLAVSGFVLLVHPFPSKIPDKIQVLIGTPSLFGCGAADIESGVYVTECVNASVVSVSGDSFSVVLRASFANATTGVLVEGGFQSQGCYATTSRSSCLILVNLGTAGSYDMTISAVGSDGNTITFSPDEWTVVYGVSIESEGME